VSYRYEDLRPQVVTDEGQRALLKVRDHVQQLLKSSGAFRVQEVLSVPGVGGDIWFRLALIDRLEELGEIRRVQQAQRVAGQDEIYVRAR
jgi:hypothetical protein